MANAEAPRKGDVLLHSGLVELIDGNVDDMLFPTVILVPPLAFIESWMARWSKLGEELNDCRMFLYVGLYETGPIFKQADAENKGPPTRFDVALVMVSLEFEMKDKLGVWYDSGALVIGSLELTRKDKFGEVDIVALITGSLDDARNDKWGWFIDGVWIIELLELERIDKLAWFDIAALVVESPELARKDKLDWLDIVGLVTGSLELVRKDKFGLNGL